MKIAICLPQDRNFAGTLCVLADDGSVLYGPVPAAGRAHSRLAKAHGNPDRNPLLPYGDTPYGGYLVERGDEVLVLYPREGDAALADANGRFRICIVGNPSGSHNGLHATAGSVRMFPEDLQRLLHMLRSCDGDIFCDIAHSDVHAGLVIEDNGPLEMRDPPPLAGAFSRASRFLTRRAALARTALIALASSQIVAPRQLAAQTIAQTAYTSGNDEKQPNTNPGSNAPM